MKLTAPANKLLDAFQVAASFAPTRTANPILTHVLMEARNGRVVFTGTDCECGATASCEAEMDDDLTALVPADKFRQILHESGEATLTIEASAKDDPNLIVRGPKSRFKIPTADPTHYPALPKPEGKQFTAFTDRLCLAVRRVSLAADDAADARYVYSAMLLEMGDDHQCRIVGCDGRVNAIQQIGAEGAACTAMVPFKGLRLLCRAVAKADPQTTITVNANYIHAAAGSVTVFLRQAEGRAFPWRKLLANLDDYATSRANAGELLRAVRQANISTSMDQTGVEFTFDGNRLGLRAAAEAGESEAEVAIEGSGSMVLAVNGGFIVDCLRNLPAESSVTLRHKPDGVLLGIVSQDGYTYMSALQVKV